jgi:cytochrome c-type biogenesis protein CcmH
VKGAAGLLLLAGLSAAQAVEPREMLADPVEEARARTISQELRCVVCQNESIDTSEAGIAHDMRVLIRQRIQAGDSDRQIVDYLRSRYGDFVLLQPPVNRKTLLLWAAPVLALAVGAVIAVLSLRPPRHRRIRA